MKILSTRTEDARKALNDYVADREARNARKDAQIAEYESKLDAVLEPLKSAIEDDLRKYVLLDLDVKVTTGGFGDKINVKVDCNQRDKFAETSALSWDYEVHLKKDGSIEKESSSWSGLKATTSDQLASLEQTLDVLKYLNSINWVEFLAVEIPRWQDIVTESMGSDDTDALKQAVVIAQLADLIGLKYNVAGLRGSGKYFQTPDFEILSESPTQFQVREWREAYGTGERISSPPYRIKKENFLHFIERNPELVNIDTGESEGFLNDIK